MRSHSEYIPLTQDQIALAQHTDIVEYLRERGEKVQKEGNHYIWEKHDSCVIHGYKWYQNSTGKHGAAVAFVQNFFHKSFPHAVLELIGNRQITFDLAAPPPTKRESKPTDMIPVAFCLPPAAPDNRRLYAYLTHTRSIAHEIVNTFIDEHLIYQDKQGNIVFVCYDCFGRVKSAHKRGTNSAQRYRSFVTGGEFNCGFSYANDNATVLYVFEAPIDLMSFLTLHRHKPWHRASYLSLGGLSEDPLRRFLKEHKSIQRIAFCFDNDINKPENRGQEAAKRFMRQFSGKYMQLINLYIDMWRDDPKRVDYHSRAERYAKALANSIVHTKGFDGGGQNSYFYDSSEGLITSIILLVAQYCKPEERHIVSVFKILLEFVQTVKSANDETDSQRKVKQTKLNEILSLLPEDDKIRWFAGSVPGSEGMQYLSVITTSMSRLLAFIDSESENILCKNSKITVADIYQKKVAVFITFPEEDATKHVLVSLFLSQIINEAIVYADECTKENKLTRRLYIFADEFGIFPYMGNILGMFGASRSRNIIIVPCIQSPAQLRQTYGADGETIIRDCCQTVIFGGFSPMSDTAVTFSKLLGNQTVAAGSVSTNNREGRGLFGSGSNSSRSVNMIARPLMTPDELQLLPFGKWVINRRGSHPFIANMPRYDKWGIRLEAPYISETREYVPTAYAKLDDVIRTIKEEKWRQTVQEKRESANSSESVGSTADY